MLRVRDLEAFYGASQALFGMELSVDAGEVVTLMGRNGMGKTTTVRSIVGLVPPLAGAIRFEGRPIHRLPSYRVAQAGIALVPEGRQIFPNLTVLENLVATAANRIGSTAPWRVETVFELFPELAARARNLGGALSGGEQQMLAIGRALMTNPRLLILDEATEGLAHFGIGADLLRRSRRDQRAVDHHRDPVGQREHRVHVVLDEHQRVLAAQRAQQLHHALRLVYAHARHRLVEQQQLGLRRQRHADL